MIKDKIKELMRPVDSLTYGIALSNSIYNTAIRDVLEILEHNGDDTRKEIAKEIFQRLEPLYFGIINSSAFIRSTVKELAQEYGVEVEE